VAPAKWPSQVAQRIHLLLNFPANKLALLGPLGSLFYGDQDKLPSTPTVCIEAGPTQRPLGGIAPGGVVENNHECYILVYHSKVQAALANKLESETIAEGIVSFLDQNLTLIGPTGEEGIVIHGWCTSIDPGYSIKEGTLYQAVRITWNGKSKTRLLGA